MNKSEKIIKYLGWAASIMSILMYVSYLPQIIDNLAGKKGNPIQPLVATFNCILWFIYGIKKKPRDLPLAIANIPGMILGIITFITAIR